MFKKKSHANSGVAPTTTTTTTRSPATRHHISGPLAALFALYFIFGVVQLGLLIDIVKYFHQKFERIVPDWIEARAGYATFVAAFTVISSILYFLLGKLWRNFRWYHVVALTILNFIFWIIAAPLLEIAFTHTPYRQCVIIFGKQKCQELKAARAFAWLLMVLSLFSIPVAWFFTRRAARTSGTQPVTMEAPTTHRAYPDGTAGTSATANAPVTAPSTAPATNAPVMVPATSHTSAV